MSTSSVHSRAGQWNLQGAARRVWENQAQVGHPTPNPSTWGLAYGTQLPPLPLHIGVLQGLHCAKPLVWGKHEQSPEEVQGLWGGVRW